MASSTSISHAASYRAWPSRSKCSTRQKQSPSTSGRTGASCSCRASSRTSVRSNSIDVQQIEGKIGAARHVRSTLKPDGTWLIVEPRAGDRVEDNLNPVGRAYYGFSTLLCTPASLSQEVGLALGAQAGEARLREVITDGGFRRIRRAAATPFNLVLEARP